MTIQRFTLNLKPQAKAIKIAAGTCATALLVLAVAPAAYADGSVSDYSSDSSRGAHTTGHIVFGSSGHDYSFDLYNRDVAADGKGSWTIVFAAGTNQSSFGWRNHNTDGNGTSHYKNGGGDVGFTIRYVEVQTCNGASASGQPINCTYTDYDNQWVPGNF